MTAVIVSVGPNYVIKTFQAIKKTELNFSSLFLLKIIDFVNQMN